jgi:hypothetical protein
MYKIIGADQKEYGPITADQLRQWISEGRVNTHTKVQAAGATEWKAMAELPEFASILPRPAPPLPIHAGGAPIASSVRNSQMAIWAMVTGIMSILCCCQIIAPVSIVLGAVALSQMKHDPQLRGSGFAITGIVLGAVALLMLISSAVYFMLNPTMLQNIQNALPQP